MNTPFITEEQLSAYVDGELPPAETEAVAAWLATHPDDQDRVQAWRADRDAMAAHFGPVLRETPPPRLQATVWRRQGMPRWAMAAAAAGLLLGGAVLGGAGAWQWQQRQQAQQMAALRTQLSAGSAQGWVQRAAYAHAVYTNEPRHAVEVGAQEEHLSRWLTRRIDIPVKLFDLKAQGFDLVGGRLLPDGPGKSAQLMYQDGEKRRVTVYLRKPEQGVDTSFRFEQQGKLGMFYWVEEGAGYALVGDLPRDSLLALAKAIYEQHPAVAPQVEPAPRSAPSPAPAASPPG